MEVKKLILDTVRTRLASEGVEANEILNLRLTFENGKAFAKVKTRNRGVFEEPLQNSVNKTIRFIFISKINKICLKKLNKEFEKLVLDVNFETEQFKILGIETVENKPNVVDISSLTNIF